MIPLIFQLYIKYVCGRHKLQLQWLLRKVSVVCVKIKYINQLYIDLQCENDIFIFQPLTLYNH